MPFKATQMQLEITKLNEARSERKRQISHITYIESKIWHKYTYLQNSNRLTTLDNRFLVAKGAGVVVGSAERIGLVNTNYYI